MFKIGDTVIYGTEGICKIADICEKEFNGICETYYILKPVFSSSSTIMVPISSETLVGRMRMILSAGEIRELIHLIPQTDELEWIEDDKRRRETYKQIIFRGDRLELTQLIKTLHERQNRQKKIGKKLHASDERFFRDAEKMLYDEFAMALGIERSSVQDFINAELGVEAPSIG